MCERSTVVRKHGDRLPRVLSTVARTLPAIVGSLLVVLLAMSPGIAYAGKPGTGEPLFYPCSACHPTDGSAEGLPNDFTGHRIKLQGHDVLGEGSQACLVCHDEASKDPGKLKLIDGSLVDITGDVALVCFRCHSAVYNEWKAGAHGRPTGKCTSSGCHDPHTPQYIFGSALLPFVGMGFTAQVRSETATFTPLAAPPLNHPIETPPWLWTLTGLAVVGVGGLTVSLIRGRPKR